MADLALPTDIEAGDKGAGMRIVFPWPEEQQHSAPLPTDIIQLPSGDRMHSDKKVY